MNCAKRSMMLAFLLCIQAVLLSGQTDTTKVKLQLRWFHQFQFAGYYAAKEKGFYSDAGFDVEIIPGGIDTDVMKEVVSGKADYGVQTPSILVDRAQGCPVVVLAAVFQHSPVALLVSAESGITTLPELDGKTIMLGQKNVEIRSMLISESMIDKVNIIEFNGNYGDVIEGKIAGSSGYITSDIAYIEGREEGVFNCIRPVTYGIDFYGDCLFTSEKVLKKDIDKALAFREASLKGWDYAMRNPDEITGLIISRYNSSAKRDHLEYEYRQMRKLIYPDIVETGHMSPGRWKHIMETFQNIGMIPPEADITGFLYTDHLNAENRFEKKLLLYIMGILFSAVLISLYYYRREKVKDRLERIRHKKELSESEEKYRNIIEFGADGILIGDNGGYITDVNEMACSIIGMKRDELVGKFVMVIPFSKESMEKEPLRFDLLRKGEIVVRERDIVRSDGTVVNIEMKTKMMNDGSYQSIFRNITVRKQRENTLKMFRAAVENSQDGIGMSTPDGRHFYQNKALTKMLGEFGDDPLSVYQDKELGGTVFSEIEAGRQWSGDLGMYSAAGELIRVHLKAYPVFDEAGRISALVGIHTDITEKSIKEQEIADLKSWFEYVLGATGTGFDIIDEDFAVQYTDPDWARLLGDFRGRKCYEYFMGRSTACPNCGIPEALTKKGPVITEEHLEKENRHIEVHTLQLEGTKDGKRLVAEFNIDITERKNIEERLRQFNAELETKVAERTVQLENANKELESFSYSVSHDLRAPVRHIIGFTDIFLKENSASLDGKARETFGKITSSALRMEKLIDDLLMLSRTGRQEMFLKKVNMNDIISAVVSEYSGCRENRNVNFSVGGLPEVRADKSLMMIVWGNLIDNACKYTVSRNPAEISVTCAEDSGEYVFCIKDNGVGFESEYAHKLFGVFQRLHLDKDFKGTGIGLANVRRIINRHGGRTWAESDGEGRGASFYFSLPKKGGE